MVKDMEPDFQEDQITDLPRLLRKANIGYDKVSRLFTHRNPEIASVLNTNLNSDVSAFTKGLFEGSQKLKDAPHIAWFAWYQISGLITPILEQEQQDMDQTVHVEVSSAIENYNRKNATKTFACKLLREGSGLYVCHPGYDAIRLKVDSSINNRAIRKHADFFAEINKLIDRIKSLVGYEVAQKDNQLVISHDGQEEFIDCNGIATKANLNAFLRRTCMAAMVEIGALADEEIAVREASVASTKAVLPPTPESPQPHAPPSTAPVVLIFDTNVLSPLATRWNQDDPASTFLPILERLMALPNVTVVLPASIANDEARGLHEHWQDNAFRTEIFNPAYKANSYSPHLVNNRTDLTKLFDSAYRIRRNPKDDSWAILKPHKKQNPKLIIVETDTCKKQPYSSSDRGEIAICQLIKDTMPFEGVAPIVVTEDNKYNWPGNIHRVGLCNVLEALNESSPETLSALGYSDHKDALDSLENTLNSLDPGGNHYHYQHEHKPTKSKETIAEVIARGVALEKSGTEVVTPLAALQAQQKQKGAEKPRSISQYGLLIGALMNGTVSYEALAEKINELNRVDAPPQSPKIDAEELQRYTSGQEYPKQDTHYALMAALVWERGGLQETEKEALTKLLMETWNLRRNLPHSQTIESSQLSHYHDYGYALTKAIGDVAPSRAMRIITQYTDAPSPWAKRPATADELQGTIHTAGRKKPQDVLFTLKALEKLLGRNLADDEKCPIFNAMIQDNNGGKSR